MNTFMVRNLILAAVVVASTSAFANKASTVIQVNKDASNLRVTQIRLQNVPVAAGQEYVCPKGGTADPADCHYETIFKGAKAIAVTYEYDTRDGERNYDASKGDYVQGETGTAKAYFSVSSLPKTAAALASKQKPALALSLVRGKSVVSSGKKRGESGGYDAQKESWIRTDADFAPANEGGTDIKFIVNAAE